MNINAQCHYDYCFNWTVDFWNGGGHLVFSHAKNDGIKERQNEIRLAPPYEELFHCFIVVLRVHNNNIISMVTGHHGQDQGSKQTCINSTPRVWNWIRIFRLLSEFRLSYVCLVTKVAGYFSLDLKKYCFLIYFSSTVPRSSLKIYKPMGYQKVYKSFYNLLKFWSYLLATTIPLV